MHASRLVIEKLDSFDELVSLEPEWRELEESSGVPFASWDWAVAWWSRLREDSLSVSDSLFVHTVRAPDGELVAVAPMMITRRPSVGPLCVRQLQFFGADPNITELRGVIARPEHHAAAHVALLRHLQEECANDWDWMLLSGVPANVELPDAEGHFEWIREIPDYELSLPDSWEELKQGLRRNIKESLRKCYNSLKRDGHHFELEVVREKSAIAPALDRFLELHGARAEASETVPHANLFSTRVAKSFLFDVCERFANRDALRIFLLRVGDRVVASRIGFVVGDSLYLYYSGYDPDYAKYSVMTTTLAEAIKYAISQKLKSINLSTGNDVSKARWNPVEILHRDALIVSPSLRGELAHELYRRALHAVAHPQVRKFAAKLLGRQSAAPPLAAAACTRTSHVRGFASLGMGLKDRALGSQV